MLLGLAALISRHQVVPRGNVTRLAQLSAAAFGTGSPFYVINLAVTLVLAFAANTSFGGLPVLMQLLARDHRLPHMFALRAEKPVFRYGITALALLAAVVLLIVSADTQKLLPVFAIGVFIGFTISQTGLVRHWLEERGPRWLGYALLNGVGAVMTAVAGIVLLASKFTEGAWLLVFLVPGLVLLMDRIERYYKFAGKQLGLGQIPPKPVAATATGGMVVVPIVAVSCVAERALQTAMRFGCEVVPVTVEVDPESTQRLREQWREWDPGYELKVLASPAPQPGLADRPLRERPDRQRPRRHRVAVPGRAAALAAPTVVQPARPDPRSGAACPHRRDHHLAVSPNRLSSPRADVVDRAAANEQDHPHPNRLNRKMSTLFL